MPSYDVAVIGLGAMGSATLYRAEEAAGGAGRSALTKFEPGHDRGSSHGESRLIGMAWLRGPRLRAPGSPGVYQKWRDLEGALTGARVLDDDRNPWRPACPARPSWRPRCNRPWSTIFRMRCCRRPWPARGSRPSTCRRTGTASFSLDRRILEPEKLLIGLFRTGGERALAPWCDLNTGVRDRGGRGRPRPGPSGRRRDHRGGRQW